MKKLAALILALALVLSAASLALAETPKTKLVVWSFTDELRGMIDKYYVPAHPEVEVVYTLYPTDGSEYRNKLDTVWLGVGPGDRLLTICNCCPCCCLWGTLPHMVPFISDKVTRMEGVSVTVNDRCVGCGQCTKGICFVDAIRLADGRATIDEDLCRGCGRCVQACPQGSIELAIEYDHTIEKVVTHIASLVDVS